YTQSIAAISRQLTRMLAERQQRIETKLTTQIGVNAFIGEIGLTPPAVVEPPSESAQNERERIEALNLWRASREATAVAHAREQLAEAIRRRGPSMEATLELARAGGTVGEWAATIADASNGRYLPPILERSAPSTQFNVPSASRRIRIALGKAGLDGHINAVKLLAQACMQAGMEVILAGFKQTPAQLVEVAVQEDAEVLAISSLAGAHLAIAHEVRAQLREKGRPDLKVVMG